MGGMEWCEERGRMKGGSDVRGFGFFNEEGFEVIIYHRDRFSPRYIF